MAITLLKCDESEVTNQIRELKECDLDSGVTKTF